jgi:acetyl esterase/lipase
MLNEAGISAYVLDYRVHPCHKLAPLSDAKRAIKVVRSMGYEKVAILGFSAGGHLTCTAATMYDLGDPDSDDPIERLSSRHDQFIPCYPVASFIQFTHNGTVHNLLGDERFNVEELKKFSNELNVTAETPEAFIWHTAADQAVPVQNSLNLAAAMSAKGVPYELHIFPYGRHGLGLAPEFEDVKQWVPLVQKFLTLRGYA